MLYLFMPTEEEYDELLPIVLPEDEKRVRQLRLKLEEYRARNPSMFRHVEWGKLKVLEYLLEHGAIRSWEELESIEWFIPHWFYYAASVVKDYCLTGGVNCGGGTGLPAVD